MEGTTEPSIAQRARLSIFRHFVAEDTPPVVEELMTEFGLSRLDTGDLLRELADTRHIALVTGTSRILMAFPFSSIASPFRVEAGGPLYAHKLSIEYTRPTLDHLRAHFASLGFTDAYWSS